MRFPKIKVKNKNTFKYKKNVVMLNHFNDFIEDKIEELEYAVIKVYFKKEGA